jgi:hypothetical protein
MAGQGRSENLVLQSTLEYMKKQLDEYNAMMAEAQLRGIETRDLKVEGLDEQQRQNGQSGQDGHHGQSGQNGHNVGG